MKKKKLALSVSELHLIESLPFSFKYYYSVMIDVSTKESSSEKEEEE
jgi:hypothetical protein